MIEFIKYDFSNETNKTGCHFITVDSYKNSEKFYEKQGFKKYPVLPSAEETVLMYYNLLKYKKLKN